jgi:hypothetical protein
LKDALPESRELVGLISGSVFRGGDDRCGLIFYKMESILTQAGIARITIYTFS